MAFRSGSDALNPLGDDHHRRRIAGGGVVDDFREFEFAPTFRAAISRLAIGRILANPFVRLFEVIQAQIVVDGFGSQDAGEEFGEGLHAVDRAVAADANQPFDFELIEPLGDAFEFLGLLGIYIGPGGS